MGLTKAQLRTYCQANGWTDGTSAGLTELDRWVNDAHQWLGRARKWSFYRKRGYFNLTAPYSTGTVACAHDATTVAGTTTIWTSAMEGQEFYFDDDTSRIYTISSRASQTFTLESGYLGTAVTVGTYSVRYVRYAAATGLWTCGPFYGEDGRELSFNSLTLEEWDRLRVQNRATAATPTDLCIENGYIYVHPAPSASEQIRYVYYVCPVTITDSVDSDWPDEFRGLILAALKVRMASANNQAAMLQLQNGLLEKDLDRAFSASKRTDGPIPINPDGGNRNRLTPGTAGAFMTFSGTETL